jgi:D-3-phosphoglycerate dehydrogenase
LSRVTAPSSGRGWRLDNPLFGLDNVVIAPHAAYYSEEAISTMRHFAAEEVVLVVDGQPPLSPVNAAELSRRVGRDHRERATKTGSSDGVSG